MLGNYLKIAARNFKKQKIYALINVAGLAVGIACSMLIALFVRSELSYDRFHENVDRIYRVVMRIHVGTNQFEIALCPSPLSEALTETFPEIVHSARLFTRQSRSSNTYVRYEDRQFKEEGFIWADPAIFKIFTIPIVSGDPESVLKEKNTVVLTPTMAMKYFGNNDPVGKMITLEDGSLYKITGIVEEMPANSNIHYDFIASFQSLSKSRDPDWYDTAVHTYILLRDGFPADQLDDKFPEFSRKYYEPIVQKTMGVSYDAFLESGNLFGFFLQPIKDIHLNPGIQNEFEPTGSKQTVVIFSAISFIILIVACINFINLATARSAKRANEVGVRKVLGSNRKQLIWQFLTESIFLSAFSVVLGIGIVSLVLPLFNNLVGKSLDLAFLLDWTFFPWIIAVMFIIGLVAGIYPAFLLASFQPVAVLKGKMSTRTGGRQFRNILVVVQFTASIVLFIGTFAVYSQLKYIRDKDLGFDKEHVVVIQSAEKLGPNQEAFKNDLKQNTDILAATFTDCLPQFLLEVKMFQKEGAVDKKNHTFITITSDYDFIAVYRPKLAEGRFFSRKQSTDDYAALVNQAALRVLDIGMPLETRLLRMGYRDKPYHIIGVLEDFHMEPLHNQIQPMAVLLLQNKFGVLLSIRIRAGRVREALGFIESRWRRFVPDQPAEYVFYDDNFDLSYETEIRASHVISTFAVLAIFIASLGLFGIASFTTEQRTKEIGIRKVMGASVAVVISLLSTDSVKWVVLANIIAWPVAYFAMDKWLQNFAYRIHMQFWMFIASAVFALVIAIITVGYQTIKAARANPVDALRYE